MKKEINSNFRPTFEAIIDQEQLLSRFEVPGVRYRHLEEYSSRAERTELLLKKILSSQAPYITLIDGTDRTPVFSVVSEEVGMCTSPVAFLRGELRMNHIKNNEINEFEHMTGVLPVTHGMMDTAKAQRLASYLMSVPDKDYQFEIIFYNLMCKAFKVEESRVYRYSSKRDISDHRVIFDSNETHKARLWNMAHRQAALQAMARGL